IPESEHAAVLDFVHAPSGWNAQAASLADCEWERVKPLFDGVKREKFNLARETIAFYEDREPELLTDDERQYLQHLVERSATKQELKDLNADAGLYFARRYGGIKSLLGDKVSWNVGQLFDFPALVADWRAAGRTSLNHSTARNALQLKFVLELEVELSTGGTQ